MPRRTGTFRLLVVLPLVAALLALAGCGGSDSGGVTTQPGTGGSPDGDWTLAAGQGPDGALALVDGRPVTLTVDGGTVGGSAACNSYGGSARVGDAGGFAVGEVASTEMACAEPEVMALEAAYLTAFGAVRTARLDGDRLVLTGEGVELRYDRTPKVPDAPVEGTRWLVEGLVQGTGDTASVSSLVGQPFVLLKDGRLTGNGGCAGLTGTYTLDRDRLVVADLRLVPVPGDDCSPENTAQDDVLADVLRQPLTVAVDERSMTLTGVASGLTLFAEGND
jgi:heat shock protein HslJ